MMIAIIGGGEGEKWPNGSTWSRCLVVCFVAAQLNNDAETGIHAT